MATDQPLKRLGGGRWQTRDERFTIEPQSGTWVIVDAAHTDELGLPLVRGPFPSLTAAKSAIAGAREDAAPASSLPRRAAAIRKASADAPPPGATGRTAARDAASASEPTGRRRAASSSTASPEPSEAPEPPTPSASRWITALEPDARRRARRTIDALAAAGAPDPEGMTRRDVAGGVPTVAAFAIVRAVRALGPDATPAQVVAALTDGRDRDLGARWRLVDGDGRSITIDPDDLTG